MHLFGDVGGWRNPHHGAARPAVGHPRRGARLRVHGASRSGRQVRLMKGRGRRSPVAAQGRKLWCRRSLGVTIAVAIARGCLAFRGLARARGALPGNREFRLASGASGGSRGWPGGGAGRPSGVAAARCALSLRRLRSHGWGGRRRRRGPMVPISASAGPAGRPSASQLQSRSRPASPVGVVGLR